MITYHVLARSFSLLLNAVACHAHERERAVASESGQVTVGTRSGNLPDARNWVDSGCGESRRGGVGRYMHCLEGSGNVRARRRCAGGTSAALHVGQIGFTGGQRGSPGGNCFGSQSAGERGVPRRGLGSADCRAEHEV
ncbi:hypothetical protein BaRGS_00036330 [Batillaria attramentaria]|uniref:Secreted protein n=1 Tax=Batillaria attramentaria TaxID=370345 RepID=A0ABD0JC31_9CAEN